MQETGSAASASENVREFFASSAVTCLDTEESVIKTKFDNTSALEIMHDHLHLPHTMQHKK